jgi:outer membrane protein
MRRTTFAGTCLFVLLLLAESAFASPADSTTTSEKPPRDQVWGVGFIMRTATIPFDTPDRSVATLIPLVMFENDRVFFREIEGGIKLVRRSGWGLNFLGRAHYFDIPAEFQNQIQGDTIDLGLQFEWTPAPHLFLDLEGLTDTDGHASAVAKATYRLEGRRWYFRGGVQAQLKGSDYNSYFWGLTQEHVDGGVAFGGALKGYYDVVNSLYLMGAVTATYLDAPVRNSDLVIDDWKWEGYLGFGLSDPKYSPRTYRLPENAYLRLSHGWATPSSLAKIIRFEAERDPGNNQMTSIFYGHPLTDKLFGLPIWFYLHTGLGWHWKSAEQDHEQEFVIAIKGYYTIPLPWRIRLGMAEGISWVTTVPAREQKNLEEKGFATSQLLNYLNPSVDINLGDITPGDALGGVWLGYEIHHRSAIYENSQQFGRISGGSNIQSFYVQYHF